MKIFAYLVLSLTCLPFAGVGAFEAYQTKRELETGSRAIGTVTGNVYSTTNNDGVASGAFHPIVEFIDASGAKRSFTDPVGSLPADYEPGAKVEVIFKPSEPQNARLYSWKRFWLAPLIFILAGALPVSIAVIILRRLDF